MKLTVVSSDQSNEWDRQVRRAPHDFYHLSSYHRLAEERGEGVARLILVEDDSWVFALPILIRRVAEVPGLESFQHTDVTSVYGYAGPLSSPRELSATVCDRVKEVLGQYFRQLGACCVFARLHPLLEQNDVLSGIGIVNEIGPTVSIDLTASIDAQWAAMRHGHRSDICRLRRRGFHCVHDAELRHLNDFMRIYNETMTRVDADDYYRFDREYFQRFFSLDGADVNLFVCLHEGVVTSGGVFTVCDGIVQYHLSGTRVEYMRMAPSKLVLDDVRIWAMGRGARAFHLGGGLGSNRDALFDFKAGFSKQQHSFKVWSWVRDQVAYEELVTSRSSYLASFGQTSRSTSYFPAYRSPSVALEDGARL